MNRRRLGVAPSDSLNQAPALRGSSFFLAGAGGPVCSRKVRNVTHFWRAAKVEGESQIFQETRFRITLRAYSTRECSTSYWRMIRGAQGAPGSRSVQPQPRPDAATQALQPSAAVSVLRGSWDPLGSPGCSGWLRLRLECPRAATERQAAAQCNPSPAQAQPRKLPVKRECVSLAWLWVPPVLAWLLQAAPEMPQARPKPRGEAPGATRAEPPK